MSTTHEVLDKGQQADFERYIRAGGGYVGVHAAADGGYTWPWYGRLVGAYFDHHTGGKDTLHVIRDKKFPVTYALPSRWVRTDEWYHFREVPQNVHRSEEHTSELQSLMRISYAVFCLKK